MTLDEEVRERTVERFLECEAKRAEARKAALDNGKTEDESHEIAHEAAKNHWNAWAEEKLAERKRLEEANVWATEKDKPGPLKPKNGETRAWMDAARAAFWHCRFVGLGDEGPKCRSEAFEEIGSEPLTKLVVIDSDGAKVDMRSFIFPGTASFAETIFSGEARFDSADFMGFAAFVRTEFKPYTWFDSATFREDARFDNATFNGYASFGNTTFEGDALFGNPLGSATFKGNTHFRSSTFKKDAWFTNVGFERALFDYSTFEGYTWFDEASFLGDVDFNNANFTKSTYFRSVKFGSEQKKTDADFTSIKVERALDLAGAKFSKVPDFRTADFKQAPDLDAVQFPLPGFWKRGDPALMAKYRAIRRMAIQSADYDREHRAFKGELRSRRRTTDEWWHPSFLLGMLYDAVADCGRSISQPAIAWATTIIVSAAFYASRALAGAEARCADGGGPFLQALYLSVKNGLVLFAGTRDARVNQAYECLYTDPAGKLHIPPSVTFVETLLQFPISAVLIFLGLLAVKNRFKIK